MHVLRAVFVNFRLLVQSFVTVYYCAFLWSKIVQPFLSGCIKNYIVAYSVKDVSNLQTLLQVSLVSNDSRFQINQTPLNYKEAHLDKSKSEMCTSRFMGINMNAVPLFVQ